MESLPDLEWSCQSLPQARWLLQISSNLSAAEQPFNWRPSKVVIFLNTSQSRNSVPWSHCILQVLDMSGVLLSNPLRIILWWFNSFYMQDDLNSPVHQCSVTPTKKFTPFLAGWAALSVSQLSVVSWLNCQQPRVTDDRTQPCPRNRTTQHWLTGKPGSLTL